MSKEEFIKELQKLNINISDKQLKDLDIYYKMLVETNKNINLTGITEEKDVYLKHFYDSLTINKVINLNEIDTLCDIGTGAGFPGLVIKILFPNIKVTLVDSLNKRLEFLNQVIKELKLKDIELVHSRIEEYGIKNREKYDIVTARAVASLNILIEYAVPLTKVNGYFIAMKANISEEIKNSSTAFNKLNCIIEEINEFNLPFENSIRNIIKIKKLKITNKLFPRKNSEIKKKPL